MMLKNPKDFWSGVMFAVIGFAFAIIVKVYDPHAAANARAVLPEVDHVATVDEALAGADIVLHLTEWDEFLALDPEQVGAVVRSRILIDGRNALDPDRWRAAGWTYAALGRPRS